MKLSSKFMRSQIAIINSVSNGFSLEKTRKWQDRIGNIIAGNKKHDVIYSDFKFENFECSMISPKDEISSCVILYLHGGGFTCGGLSYAKGFGSVLSSRYGCKVLAPAYRLAPENPFPCALDDAYEAYKYLLGLGITHDRILLCGESAGGGLCYSLCLRLKKLREKMPAGIIAISPWTDHTASGESYETNKKHDPSMTKEKLEFFSDSYIYGIDESLKDKRNEKINPYISPAFANLSGMPKSIIFAGGYEVMLDDAKKLHQNLISSKVDSHLVISPKMWHVYVLYGLKEHDDDMELIGQFIKATVPYQKKLRWMGLDNSAKIYPAARRRNWSNVFRISATLDENVDTSCLKDALDIVSRRFPSIAVRLKTGMFWYYIEEVPKAPEIMEEKPYPLSRMAFDDIRKCAFRVIVYKKRIAVEFFHALTDGNGGLIFLKTLVAEYLKLRYGISIPCEKGIYDTLEEPKPRELEDSFMKIRSKIHGKRYDTKAYKLSGTPETDGFRTNTTFIFDSQEIIKKSKEYGVTVTAFMSAIFAKACIEIQKQKVKNPKKHKNIKILIPINLRKIYASETLRNFIFYVTPGVDPRLGEYSVEELSKIFYHQMCLQISEKQLSSRISPNVDNERSVLKYAPLFLKNIVMKLIFNAVGEKTSCFTFSNLGIADMPNEMKEHITRMGFVLGVQSYAPYNTALITYNDKMYLNIIRNIKEPLLENAFYNILKEIGIRPCVESNTR